MNQPYFIILVLKEEKKEKKPMASQLLKKLRNEIEEIKNRGKKG